MINEDYDKKNYSKVYLQYLLDRGIKLKGLQKQKALKDGVLILAGVDAAKADLKKNAYDATTIPQLVIQFNLNDSQNETLQQACLFHKKNEKKKVQREISMDSSIKLQDAFNQKIQQQLSILPDSNAKIDFLYEQNIQNRDAFTNYLYSLQGNQQNFLSLMAAIIQKEEIPKHRLRLFLAVCRLYQGYPLKISVDLYEPMLVYIVEQKNVESTWAMAFLRLAFQNNISFASSSPAAIKKFDDKFKEFFGQLFSSLQSQYEHQSLYIGYMPPTSMLLSSSVIKTVKDQPSAFAAIPFNYAERLIHIFTYVFSDDHKSLIDVIKTIVDACNNYREAISEAGFMIVLTQLLQRVQAQDLRWFKNMKAVHEFFKDILHLIVEKKIELFDETICNDLLNDYEVMQQHLSKPSILKEKPPADLYQLFKQLKIRSSAGKVIRKDDLSGFNCNQPIDSPFTKALTLIGVNPSALQQLSLKLVQQHPFIFLNPGAGTGKSTMLIALAIGLAKEPVLCLNADAVLLQRDFNRCRDKVGDTFSIELLQQGATEITTAITFLLPQQLDGLNLPPQFHILFDEYHTLFSDETINLMPMLQASNRFIAVSGSPCEIEHVRFLLAIIPKSLYIAFPEQNKYNLLIKDVALFNTQLRHISAIAKIATRERFFAPVLLIMDEQQAAAYTKLTQKVRGPTTLLFGDDLTQVKVNTILEDQFLEKIDAYYGVFITNRQGGTGVDYPTNNAINEAGGVRVVICIEPETFGELEQFKKRTGRMEGNGQVFFVLRAPTDTPSTTYLKSLTKTLKRNEINSMNKLLKKVKAPQAGIHEDNEEGNDGNNEGSLGEEILEHVCSICSKVEGDLHQLMCCDGYIHEECAPNDVYACLLCKMSKEELEKKGQNQISLCIECGADPTKKSQCLTCNIDRTHIVEAQNNQNEDLNMIEECKLCGAVNECMCDNKTVPPKLSVGKDQAATTPKKSQYKIALKTSQEQLPCIECGAPWDNPSGAPWDNPNWTCKWDCMERDVVYQPDQKRRLAKTNVKLIQQKAVVRVADTDIKIVLDQEELSEFKSLNLGKRSTRFQLRTPFTQANTPAPGTMKTFKKSLEEKTNKRQKTQ